MTEKQAGVRNALLRYSELMRAAKLRKMIGYELMERSRMGPNHVKSVDSIADELVKVVGAYGATGAVAAGGVAGGLKLRDSKPKPSNVDRLREYFVSIGK